MPVRVTILQEIWWYSEMKLFWCIQCCNRTRCNLQTLLCVEKAMLVAFQLLSWSKFHVELLHMTTKVRKFTPNSQIHLKIWPQGYMFYGDGPHMYIEFSLSGQLNILICFVICAQSLVLFQQCEYQKTNCPTFGAIRNYFHIIMVSLTITWNWTNS